MTQHTPGPWIIDEGLPPPDIDGDWIAVCSTERGEPGGVVGWVHPANARLIAAAPELFTALRTMVAEFRFNGEGHAQKCIAAARAAIAKATQED